MWKPMQAEDMPWSLFPYKKGRWFLVTAGQEDHCNTLLVNLGGLLSLWGRSCAAVFIRESRYTRTLLDQETYFSIAVMPDDKKDAMRFMGHHSGRDGDKWAESGLTPVMISGVPAPAEADLVLICRKLCACPLADIELPPDIAQAYQEGRGADDPHIMYIGEIQSILQKE